MGLFDKLKSVLSPASEPSPREPEPAEAAVLEPPCRTCWGHFDFESDPAAWYVVERRFERCADEPAKVARLLAENGLQNEDHFYAIREAFGQYEHWILDTQGQQAWNEFRQVLADADSAAVMQEYRQAFDEADTGLLEPIEGVSIQDYGRIAARVVGGQDLNAVLKEVQMDPAKYARVSEAWNQRMAEDTTFTITGEYSKAFMPAANATVGNDGGEPRHSWEQVTEAMVAMEHGTAAGLDPQGILGQLGMTLNEYVTASQYWGDWFVKNCVRRPELNEEYTRMTERLHAKYATAKQDTDLAF